MGLPSTVEVTIELLVDKIDCPGMRLPDKDMTYLRIYLFDVDVRTAQAPPHFPITFQEQFQFCKKFYAMKDWTELEVMLRFQALTVELLQRQIGGYSKILAEYQGNAWDVLVACNHDPVDSPVTSEGRARLVMKPTIHMPTTIAPECHIRFLVSTIGWTPPWRPFGATVKERHQSSKTSLPKTVWTSTDSIAHHGSGSKNSNIGRGSGGLGDQIVRGAIVSAEIDVLKVCCQNIRYRPTGRVYIQITYLGQAASTTPKLPSFPLHISETLVFREVLDASGDEGRFGVGAAGEHLSRARLRIELKQTGPTDHPILGYVEVRGWQLLTPVEESLFSEIEENVQLKLLALGPFLYNGDPTVHLVTRALIQPLKAPAPLLGDSGRASRHSSTVKKVVRMKHTTDARPPFVVRRVPSDIFQHFTSSTEGPFFIRRSRSLTRNKPTTFTKPSRASSPIIVSTPLKTNSQGTLFRSRSADDVAIAASSSMAQHQRKSNKVKAATEAKVRLHGTPPSFAFSSCRRQPKHDRFSCRVCCLYEEYFGEAYPGHAGTSRDYWSSSEEEDEDVKDDWGDRVRSKVSRAVGALVSESASDCSLSMD